jgi:hypothetical protein
MAPHLPGGQPADNCKHLHFQARRGSDWPRQTPSK